MKLRQHRRRTISRMRWRQPIWISWSEVGTSGEPTGNGGFKFVNLHPRTEFVVQHRTVYGEHSEWVEAQVVKLCNDVQQVCGMTDQMRRQPVNNSSQWEQAVKRHAALAKPIAQKQGTP
jgi:hypothetical protein